MSDDDGSDKDALVARADAGAAFDFVFFWGHTPRAGAAEGPWLLSQWYPAPFVVDDVEYPTAEHFMMAQKAALFGDDEHGAAIVAAVDPAEVKALGRRIRRFDGATWSAAREAIVTRGSTEKFRQNPALRRYLESTGAKILVVASPQDAIWGVGVAEDDERARDPRRWPGLNLLGACLMRARATLRAAG
jgi:ribA/ribD-fused uncharacterized protein